jgi:hypothetical protein
MHERDWTRQGRPLRAQGCDALRSCARESTLHLVPRASGDTPVKDRANRNVSVETSPGNPIEPAKTSTLSRRAASNRRHDRVFRENIIGHGLPAAWRITGLRFARLRRVLNTQRVLALFHQPSREHGSGGFFQPGIEQLGNLLAQICGVIEPRELKALEGVLRR